HMEGKDSPRSDVTGTYFPPCRFRRPGLASGALPLSVWLAAAVVPMIAAGAGRLWSTARQHVGGRGKGARRGASTLVLCPESALKRQPTQSRRWSVPHP